MQTHVVEAEGQELVVWMSNRVTNLEKELAHDHQTASSALQVCVLPILQSADSACFVF